MHISQPTIIAKYLERAGLTQCNTRLTPLPKNSNFDNDQTSSPLAAPERLLYQSLLGVLRYLADSTRLYISFAVARVVQHLHQPSSPHMHLLNHTIRYRSATVTDGILYQKSQAPPLEAYSDAD